jgi:hypothetical protein
MAVSDFALTSLANVKDALALSDTDTSRDRYLEREIDRATAEIERYCFRPISAREFLEDADGSGGPDLVVDNGPLLEVLTLEHRYSRSYTTDFLAYTEDFIDSLVIDGDRMRLRYYVFFRGTQNIRVRYVGGYAELEIPFSNNKLHFTVDGTDYTAYLPIGRHTPWQITEMIEYEIAELEPGRTHAVEFSFRKGRLFTIEQEGGGTFALSPNESGSVLPTLGFGMTVLSGATEYTSTESVTLMVPGDIEKACVEIVAGQYDSSDHGRGNRVIKSERVAGYSVTFIDDMMTKEIQSVLDRYRRYSL